MEADLEKQEFRSFAELAHFFTQVQESEETGLVAWLSALPASTSSPSQPLKRRSRASKRAQKSQGKANAKARACHCCKPPSLIVKSFAMMHVHVLTNFVGLHLNAMHSSWLYSKSWIHVSTISIAIA